MIKTFKTFDVALTVLSPIHIGCGEDYEPTNFVADPQSNRLYIFDLAQVPLNSKQRERLINAIKDGTNARSKVNPITPIYHFYKKEISTFKAFSRDIIPFDKVIEERIQSLSRGNIKNDCRIQRITYYNTKEFSVPYIPGSSLKGVIHTAFLDRLAQGMDFSLPKNPSMDDLDDAIFKGKQNNSPMKLISVSDFHACDPLSIQRYLLSADRLFIKDAFKIDKSNLTGVFEVLTKAQYRAFGGTITLRNPAPSEKIAKNQRFYKTIQDLFKDLNRYSLAEFEKEIDFWERVNNDNNLFFKLLVKLIGDLEPELRKGSVALIRIGKNTGAQNMTLRKPGIPKIKINNKDKEKAYTAENPTTVFGANDDKNYQPFGWALLELNPQSSNESLRQWCNNNGSKFDSKKLRLNFRKEREEILANYLEDHRKHEEERRKQLEERKKQEEEQRKRQEEELKKKKEEEHKKFLSSLPEEKRQLLCLKEKILKEGEVNPGTETAKMLNNIMDKAKSWSLENKKAFVDELGPLVKKYISKGRINKDIKKVLAEFREAK